MPQERTPKNAAGPFYVVKEVCVACRAPEAEASELMDFDEHASSCYFRRQPATADETYHAIRALWVSCCGALRYDGADQEIAQRLVDVGLADQIDGHHDQRPSRGPRDRVTFAFVDPKTTPAAVLAELGRRILARHPEHSVTKPSTRVGVASLGYSWAHHAPGIELRLRLSDQGSRRWVLILYPAHSPALLSIAMLVDDVLRAEGWVSDIRWYTKADRAAGRGTWSPLPV